VGATDVLVAAVWHGRRVDVSVAELDAALRLARRNQVQGALARVYPEELDDELDQVLHANAEFGRSLGDAVDRLRQGGVEPILIKTDPAADFVYSNFDLVVGPDGWAPALRALEGWARRRSGHPLEPDKLILHPLAGPAAHLHRDASWFGVVAIPAAQLRANARFDVRLGVLRPEPEDELRLMVAHAVFQNLAFDMAELVAIRDLLRLGADPYQARRRCDADGWGAAFAAAFGVAVQAIAALDRGEPIHLPVSLPTLASLRAGVRHALHLAENGQVAMGLREATLRVPLVLAKLRRRMVRRPVQLVGVSGPDGAGKTTLVAALRHEAERHHADVVSLHPYGCFICRRLPTGLDSVEAALSDQAHSGAMWTRLQRAHAVVDAAELDLRVSRARTWLRLRGLRHPDRPALVITDRSPLDALAKHSRAGGLVTRWLLGVARRYDRILLLDADDALLAERDREHTSGELARVRARFVELGTKLSATRMDSSAPFSVELVGNVLREVARGRRTPAG
jgi:thymidylate kinase